MQFEPFYESVLIHERIAKEALINSANVMKGEARGTQQPRHINQLGERVSAEQRRDSLVQSINQRFPKFLTWFVEL
ncbi:MAG: hypothetical protein HRU77_09950 [Gammaproteobacteria bacterium]|nr:MAG: hypothetical protein HRU77_09950 [Gammaproteobacteria bacterium]